MIVVPCDQRSHAWRLHRVGRATGSKASAILATVKSGEAAARRDYRLQLVCERLTGQPQDSDYINDDMQRGIDLEPAAFAAYEALTGLIPSRVGFVMHDTLWAGASPDGLLDGGAGILELKVPRSATHLRYLRDGGLPKEHEPQILHNLLVTGARYADFLSFDPRFPPDLQTFYVRVEPTADALDDYRRKLTAFLEEVELDLAALRTVTNPSAQLRASLEMA